MLSAPLRLGAFAIKRQDAETPRRKEPPTRSRSGEAGCMTFMTRFALSPNLELTDDEERAKSGRSGTATLARSSSFGPATGWASSSGIDACEPTRKPDKIIGGTRDVLERREEWIVNLNDYPECR